MQSALFLCFLSVVTVTMLTAVMQGQEINF